MFKSFNNWAMYPKLISLCFTIFSLARIVIAKFTNTAQNMQFWFICLVIGLIFFVVFNYLNNAEELKRVTKSESYKAAYEKLNNLYKHVMNEVKDKDTRVFIANEMKYIKDKSRQFIFLNSINEKVLKKG